MAPSQLRSTHHTEKHNYFNKKINAKELYSILISNIGTYFLVVFRKGISR